jgi:hypothetical protein
VAHAYLSIIRDDHHHNIHLLFTFGFLKKKIFFGLYTHTFQFLIARYLCYYYRTLSLTPTHHQKFFLVDSQTCETILFLVIKRLYTVSVWNDESHKRKRCKALKGLYAAVRVDAFVLSHERNFAIFYFLEKFYTCFKRKVCYVRKEVSVSFLKLIQCGEPVVRVNVLLEHCIVGSIGSGTVCKF